MIKFTCSASLLTEVRILVTLGQLVAHPHALIAGNAPSNTVLDHIANHIRHAHGSAGLHMGEGTGATPNMSCKVELQVADLHSVF